MRGQEIARARELYEQGVAAFRRGDAQEAQRLSQEALEVGEATGDPATIVRGLIGLSRVAFRAQDHERVRDLCERAAPLWSSLEDRTVVTSPIHMLAESARLQGELDRARSLYEESIAFGRESGDDEHVAMELNNKALLELQAGDLQQAERLAKESAATVEPSGMDLAYILLTLGAVAAGRGEARKGAVLLAASERALRDQDATYDPADQPVFDRARTLVEDHLGRDALEAAWSEGTALTDADAGKLLGS